MFLTDTMYTILTKLERRRMLAASIALRARIILLAHQRLQNSRIAELLDVERHCVGRWRRRWQESFDAILSIEMNEPQAVLERAIIDTLRDSHRSGSPGRFSAEQIVQLIAIACEDPRDSNRPVEEWTGPELADELQKTIRRRFDFRFVGQRTSSASGTATSSAEVLVFYD